MSLEPVYCVESVLCLVLYLIYISPQTLPAFLKYFAEVVNRQKMSKLLIRCCFIKIWYKTTHPSPSIPKLKEFPLCLATGTIFVGVL